MLTRYEAMQLGVARGVRRLWRSGSRRIGLAAEAGGRYLHSQGCSVGPHPALSEARLGLAFAVLGSPTSLQPGRR